LKLLSIPTENPEAVFIESTHESPRMSGSLGCSKEACGKEERKNRSYSCSIKKDDQERKNYPLSISSYEPLG